VHAANKKKKKKKKGQNKKTGATPQNTCSHTCESTGCACVKKKTDGRKARDSRTIPEKGSPQKKRHFSSLPFLLFEAERSIRKAAQVEHPIALVVSVLQPSVSVAVAVAAESTVKEAATAAAAAFELSRRLQFPHLNTLTMTTM
jgi:hypothetical protein